MSVIGKDWLSLTKDERIVVLEYVVWVQKERKTIK